MKRSIQKLNEQIDSLALITVMLDSGDIPGLGEVLKCLDGIEDSCKIEKEESLIPLIGAMRGYIEKVVLGEKTDLTPVEASISQLQEICRDVMHGKKINNDISSIIESLDCGAIETSRLYSMGENKVEVTEGPVDGKIEDGSNNTNNEMEVKEESLSMNEEDREIVLDFVAESLENLGTIEVKLLDLEQDPSDLETINAIFRPFHTVKGVSGFLNFNKINKLAHISENLLDQARNGELHIDGEVVDVILDSVDLLKNMIENVQTSLNSGRPLEGDNDIEHVVDRIGKIITQAEEVGEKPLGQMLVIKGKVSETDVEDALEIQKKEPEKKIGEILVGQEKVEAKDVVSSLREQRRFSQPTALQVKVDTRKLDNIVDMVGELAIAQSMLRQNEVIKESNDRKLDQITNQLNLITSGLQKTAMALRMVPIRNTFQKMLRLVRDLAKKAGKEVQLVMEGEDTEIDRNMVEEIYEPMVHMIRNSIDHGLEPPEERESENKPRQGTIHLKAYHRGGDIVIEIKDDGRGLNRGKILKKAIAIGLIKEEDKLNETEIYNLIFHPGFSTAEKITDISGRGVGMDVVKSKIIERLRGRVDIESDQGLGTTVFIRLPLTLAIMDGMIIKVAGKRYIIPTLAVQESFRPKKNEYTTVKRKGEMIKVRESLVPLVRLNKLLGVNGNGGSISKDEAPWEKLVMVVENQERRKCLLIDELLGQEEIVIKSLGCWLKNIKGIAGGAIMGDGRVGLILDVAGIFSIASGE